MKKLTLIALSFSVILFNTVLLYADSDFVGIVKSVSNEAHVLRKDLSIPAEVNMEILSGDVIKTGENASLGLVFQDDTVVSMGPSSEFVVEDYLFNPADKKLSLVVRMFKGTFAFLSGQITKLSPDSVKLETPDATIGMRGTHVLIEVAGG